jgi:hypothetical protein
MYFGGMNKKYIMTDFRLLKRLLLTNDLASGGVYARGHFNGNLEAHRPSQL